MVGSRFGRYDARSGWLLTQDPIGWAGGINLYEYAGSNPVAFSDPFGLCHEETAGGDSTQTRYGHLSRLCVAVGDTVQQGQLIGYSGETDSPGAPHLHYEERRITEGSGVARGTSTPITPGAMIYQANGTQPLAAMTRTSGFGIRDLDHDGKADYRNGKIRMHDGVDLRAASGTPVYATRAGVVVVAGPVRGYGLTVFINH